MASTNDMRPASAGNVKAAINTTMDNLKQAMGGGIYAI